MSSAVGAAVPSSNFQFLANGQDSTGENGVSCQMQGFKRERGRSSAKGQKGGAFTNSIDQLGRDRTTPFSKTFSAPNSQRSATFNGYMESRASGPLLCSSPEELGFKRVLHKPRGTPKYLIEQKPSLKPRPFVQDKWDYENQQKMLAIESQISDSTELWETFKKMRETERRVMEDKKLVDRADSAKDLNDAIIFQGTCQDMCPIFERARRSVENNVVRYEREKGKTKAISRQKALKVFARPAAAAAPPLPSDVRPPQVLVKTLDYIVNNIISKLPDCEGFLWDRMRSIRQDFTYQNYSGPEAVDCNERIVRVHLLILHVMATSDVEYSRQQELEQLHKALITLSEIYDEVRASGGQSPNEAEFRAYSLLSRVRDPEYDRMAQSLPQSIFDDDMVQLALCFRRILSNSTYSERGHIKTENGVNLYKRFFELIKLDVVPFLMSSFLEVHLNEVRFYAVKSLSHSINKKHKPVLFDFLRTELMFNNDDELIKFCEYYSIEQNQEGVKLTSLSHHSHTIPEKSPLKQSYLEVVNQKLFKSSPKELIDCGKPNIDTIPFSSTKNAKQYHSVNDSSLYKTRSNENSPATTPSFDWSARSEGPQFSLQNATKSQQFGTSVKFENNATDNQFLAHNVEASKQKSKNIIKDEEYNENGLAAKLQKKDVVQRKIEEQKRLKETREGKLLEEQQQKETQQLEVKRQQARERAQLHSKAANLVAQSVLQDVVHKQISAIVEKQLVSSTKKARTVHILAEELYQAFLHETLFLLTLETKADLVHKASCLKQAMRFWRSKYSKKCEQRELDKKRSEELAQVGRYLGVPQVKRHKVETTPVLSFSFTLPSVHQNQVMHTPTPNEVSQFKTPVHANTAIWNALDLKSLYLSAIERNASRLCSEKHVSLVKPIQIEISVYSRNWNSISARWLLSKFGLQGTSKRMLKLKNETLCLAVNAVASNFSPQNFKNLQLLVFNSGVTESDIFDLEVKLKQDGEKLIELVHGVALNTNFKVSIMVVYWESTENPLSDGRISKLLKLDRISEIFGAALKSVQIVKLAGDSPHRTLEQHLAKVAESVSLELTKRGSCNLSLLARSSQASSTTPANYKTAREIDSKLCKALELEVQKYQQERDRNNTYAYLQSHVAASPRARRRKLPVLLSDCHQNKFKTPLAVRPFVKPTSSMSSTSSIASSEPSHLAAKIRTERPRAEATTSTWTSPVPSRTHVNDAATPSIAVPAANTSGISNVTFDSPFSTPTLRVMPSSTDPRDTSASVLELRNLVASVKKSLNRH
ncbi:LAME_0G11386g1_1 [Lachancea meyersii CBS 8951]|uniref:Nuclear mRNA export factor n=1 Tax=Lachancea meyersii CBS 8951 TaxID=1266667 RepID=A0A1G4K9A0_9SACH|nr:LAME_0G11386g1_1 [Lachancea meyersii CBS 8951]